jgi:GTP cyclohydrolase I
MMNDREQIGKTPGIVTTADVLAAIESLAAPALAEAWDHIGLQVGHPDTPVRKALIALDVTPRVLAEAAAEDCQLLVSHHPLIFQPLASLREDVPEQQLVRELVRLDISLIVAHTNLDVAPGGVADSLAAALWQALVLPAAEPGYGLPIYPELAHYGRLLTLPQPGWLSEILRRIRVGLGSTGCRINTDQDRLVTTIAVFPGSFPEEAVTGLRANPVDLVVCGEIKHHVGLMLQAGQIAVIDAGHDVSERVALSPLASRLAAILPQIQFAVARPMHYNEVAF